MLATLDFAFCIGSTPTFFCFDLYLNIACAAHYVYELTTDMLFDQYIFKIYFLVMENGDSDVQNEYPIVSTVGSIGNNTNIFQLNFSNPQTRYYTVKLHE